MDRGAWWAAVRGVTELDAIEETEHAQHTQQKWCKLLITLIFISSSGKPSLTWEVTHPI